VRVLAYGPEGLDERRLSNLGLIGELLAEWPVTWVNVEGVDNPNTVKKIGEIFGLHPLALQDAVNVPQRPKVDYFEGTLFVVARTAAIEGGLSFGQVGLFLGRNFVVTFLDRPAPCLDAVREQIRLSKGVIRSSGPDYLAYALLDAVVDAYFPVLEQYGERLDALEEEVVSRPDRGTVSEVHAAKRDLLALRRAV
jgi:magnesium transporter